MLAGGAVLLAGCERPEQIRVYQAPKDKPVEAILSTKSDTPPVASRARAARPKVSYQAPKEWGESAPNDISVANFSVKGAEGKSANISIAPLPPLANREAEVVNMWRSQMGLPEVSAAEATALLKDVDVAGGKGKIFELSTSGNSADGPQRIVTVMMHQSDTSWFYKISGDDAIVTAQKENFLSFIKTVKFEAAPSTPAPSASSASSSSFGWKVPADWKEVAPGAMQNAKFTITAQNGVTADVTVSIFPSSTGDNLTNVNRWRRQIGLPEVDEAGLSKLIQPLDTNNKNTILVDMENQDKRLIAAIVPRSSGWFFYKLMGGTAAVASQKEAFVSFVRSEP